MEVYANDSLFQDYNPDNPDTVQWPAWMFKLTNISHFLLAFACSANFYIYYAKHGQVCRRKFGRRDKEATVVEHTRV